MCSRSAPIAVLPIPCSGGEQAPLEVEPNTEAAAVLALLSAYASREARGGEAEELLFWAPACRHAALQLSRYQARHAALKAWMPERR
jgi:hypothetical protein